MSFTVRGEGPTAPKGERPIEVSVIKWSWKKVTWVKAKVDEKAQRELDRASVTFKEAKEGVYYIQGDKVYHNGKRVADADVGKIEKAKQGAIKDVSYKAGLFLRGVSTLVSWINEYGLKATNKQAYVKVEVKSLATYFNEEYEKNFSANDKTIKAFNSLEGKTHSDFGMTEEEFEGMKGKMHEYSIALSNWTTHLYDVATALYDGRLQEGMDLYAEGFNKEPSPFQALIKSTEDLLGFAPLLKQHFGLNIDQIVLDQRKVFENSQKAAISEGLTEGEGLSSWSSALGIAEKSSIQFGNVVAFRNSIDGFISSHDAFLQKLEVVTFFAYRFPKEFRASLKKQGLTDVEIAAYISAHERAYEHALKIRTGLDMAKESIGRSNYSESYSLYKKFMEIELPKYRDALSDIMLYEAVEAQSEIEGVQVAKPYTKGVEQFIAFLKKEDVGEVAKMEHFDPQAQAHFSNHLEFYERFARSANTVGVPITKEDFEDISKKKQKEQLILNRFVRTAHNMVGADVRILPALLTFPSFLSGRKKEWAEKIRTLQKKGWTGKEIANFTKLYNDYGNLTARLYLLQRAMDRDPGNRDLKRQVRNFMKESRNEIERLRKQLTREKMGQLSDIYQEFVGSLPSEDVEVLPTDFLDYGKLLRLRDDFVRDLTTKLHLSEVPITGALSLFPYARDRKWNQTLEKNGWDIQKIHKFEKAFIKYSLIIDDLRLLEQTNKLNPEKMPRSELKEKARKKQGELIDLRDQIFKEFGGIEGARKLSDAMHEMQSSLEEQLTQEKNVTEKRKLEEGITVLKRANIVSDFSSDLAFSTNLYKDLNLAQHPILGFKKLWESSEWTEAAKETKWNAPKVQGGVATIWRLVSMSKSEGEELDELYSKYAHEMEEIISLRQLAQRDSKYGPKLKQLFQVRVAKLIELQNKIAPSMQRYHETIENTKQRLEISGRLTPQKLYILKMADFSEEFEKRKTLVEELSTLYA